MKAANASVTKNQSITPKATQTEYSFGFGTGSKSANTSVQGAAPTSTVGMSNPSQPDVNGSKFPAASAPRLTFDNPSNNRYFEQRFGLKTRSMAPPPTFVTSTSSQSPAEDDEKMDAGRAALISVTYDDGFTRRKPVGQEPGLGPRLSGENNSPLGRRKPSGFALHQGRRRPAGGKSTVAARRHRSERQHCWVAFGRSGWQQRFCNPQTMLLSMLSRDGCECSGCCECSTGRSECSERCDGSQRGHEFVRCWHEEYRCGRGRLLPATLRLMPVRMALQLLLFPRMVKRCLAAATVLG